MKESRSGTQVLILPSPKEDRPFLPPLLIYSVSYEF